jgi:hypothetical protein
MTKKVNLRGQVEIHEEWAKRLPDNDMLCLQRVTYHYPNGGNDAGYRFIRRGPDWKMKAQRGQANCVTIGNIKSLLASAETEIL